MNYSPLPAPRFPIQWKVCTFLAVYGPQDTEGLACEFDIALGPLRYFLDLLRDEEYIDRVGARWVSRCRWDPDADGLKADAE